MNILTPYITCNNEGLLCNTCEVLDLSCLSGYPPQVPSQLLNRSFLPWFRTNSGPSNQNTLHWCRWPASSKSPDKPATTERHVQKHNTSDQFVHRETASRCLICSWSASHTLWIEADGDKWAVRFACVYERATCAVSYPRWTRNPAKSGGLLGASSCSLQHLQVVPYWTALPWCSMSLGECQNFVCTTSWLLRCRRNTFGLNKSSYLSDIMIYDICV